MADDVDRAKDLEMMQRKNALDDVLSKPDRNAGEQQLFINDEVCCIDCYEPIPQERLQIKPDAVRCVYCKEIWEKTHP